MAGGFIVGAVITPDMTRFNRTAADVVKQTVVGFTVGEYLIGMSGVLLAHAIRSDDIITIVTSSVGWVGTLVIILGTLKINDWNLYSSGLGVVNFVDTVFGKRVNRAVVTLLLGVVGSVLAAGGILDNFIGFLTVLGRGLPADRRDHGRRVLRGEEVATGPRALPRRGRAARDRPDLGARHARHLAGRRADRLLRRPGACPASTRWWPRSCSTSSQGSSDWCAGSASAAPRSAPPRPPATREVV